MYKISVLTAFMVLLNFTIHAQETSLTSVEINNYEEKVEGLVSFLGLAFNTIGSKDTPPREKETIITQSYLKAFRDNKVQVEDDLVEHREVVTNKDVQAYLKDIDFFFKDVKFELTVDEINHFQNAENNLFFKVSLTRNMNGETVDGDVINNTSPRFIEINLDEKSQDLKIVSIYTTKLSMEEDVKNWWDELSYEWRSIFKRKIGVLSDELTIDQLFSVVDIQDLDLEDNKYIIDINPLSKIAALTDLNLSGTNITDLLPLRNLNKLKSLDLSNTPVSDLSPLKYATSIENLSLNNSLISEVDVLSAMVHLKNLDLGGTNVVNLSAISGARELEELNINNTSLLSISTLGSLKQLKKLDISESLVNSLGGLETIDSLEQINCSNTAISSFEPLKGNKKLRVVFADKTAVSILDPLSGIPTLQKIYCDNTKINDQIVKEFRSANPGVLVIHKSENMEQWWTKLSFDWKNALRESLDFKQDPDKDQLAQMGELESINLSGSNIVDLEPIRALRNLKILDCSKTTITNIKPLFDLALIEDLNIASTSVKDISGISALNNLQKLDISNTYIDTLADLSALSSLRYFNCEDATLKNSSIINFMKEKSDCLVIWQSKDLKQWWENLSDDWMKVFQKTQRIENDNDFMGLHRLVSVSSLTIENNSRIKSLKPLEKFIRLRELVINNTAIDNLWGIDLLTELQLLQVTRCPVKSLNPIRKLSKLGALDFSNTPIEDVDPISDLTNIRSLKFSSTEVKNLKPLSYLINLRSLELDNTNVNSLSPIEDLFGLRELICYNTRLNSKKVDKFKSGNPDCAVTFY